MSEAVTFLDNSGKMAMLAWLESGAIVFHEIGIADLSSIRATLEKYRDLSPDFTDAVLVSMAGIHGIDKIVAVDVRNFFGVPFAKRRILLQALAIIFWQIFFRR